MLSDDLANLWHLQPVAYHQEVKISISYPGLVIIQNSSNPLRKDLRTMPLPECPDKCHDERITIYSMAVPQMLYVCRRKTIRIEDAPLLLFPQGLAP